MATHKFKGFTINQADVKIRLTLDRMTDNFNRAQYALDSMVMTSMAPFMPMQDGTFINQTRAKSAAMAGSGEVCAGVAPQGRFLYEGKTMVDEKTGSPWARKGAKKVLVSQYAGKTQAKENLVFSQHAHPKAQSHWFDPAKEADGRKWIKTVKQIAGGG